MAEQQHAREHQGRGVGLVLARVLGRGTVHGLEDGRLGADIRPRRDTQTADETGAQVTDDVPVEVRQDEYVVQLGLLDELHAHVVDDAVLEGDPALVLGGDRPATLQEQAVRELHDVGLVDGRDLAPPVGDRVLEGEAGDPLGSRPGDDLDALGGIRADHVLDSGVEVFGVLADDDQVHVVVAGLEARDGPDGSEVRVQPQSLPQGDVDGPKSDTNGRRDGSLERDLVPQDGVENRLGKGCSLLGHDGLAGVHDLPVEFDTRGVQDAPCRLGQFGADTVSGDERHFLGHGSHSIDM